MLNIARKIMDVLRGGTHPAGVGVSVALGVLAGLVLGRNGLVILLFGLMLVLNVNKPAFGMALGPCAAIGWFVAPLKFGAGRWLLSVEPVAAFFQGLANAPVGALMGFDTYSVAGGLVVALPAALAAGVVSWRITRRFRNRMLSIKKDQGKLGTWSRSALVRLARWLLLGPEEPDYEKSLTARPKIVRMSGVVALALVAVLVVIGSLFDHGALVRGLLEKGLTDAAGAQVDIADLTFRPAAASLRVEGFAVTDAEEPAKNAFEAKVLAADVGVTGLLRRSLVIDEARASDFATDTPRKEPGRVVDEREDSAEEPERERPSLLDKALPIGRYLDWGRWRGRFGQLRRVLSRLQAYRDRASGAREEAPAPGAETEEELARRAAAEGYSSIRAREIVRTVPDLLVRKLLVEDIATGDSVIGAVDVYVENLAYPASLAPGPLVFRVSDAGGTGEIELTADPGERAGPITLRGSFSGLPAKSVSEHLSSAVPIVFEKGTIGVTFAGTAGRVASGTIDEDTRRGRVASGSTDQDTRRGRVASGSTDQDTRRGRGWIDLTVDVRCVDLVAKPRGRKGFLGLRAAELDDALEDLKELGFKLIIRGDPSQPRVRFVDSGLAKKLKDAALRTAKRRADEKLREGRERLEQKAGDKLREFLKDKTKKAPDAGKVLEDILRK